MKGIFIMNKLIFSAVISLFIPFSLSSQITDPGLQVISGEKVEAPLEFLASDWTEGREAGTKGAWLASDYIAGLFKLYGVKPMGNMTLEKISRERRMKGEKPETYRSYFQNFDMLTGSRKPEFELYLQQITPQSAFTKKLIEGVDFQVRGPAGTMEIDAPVVFLGYGVKNEKLKSNPWHDTDVNGKIVFIVSGFPGIKDSLSLAYQTLKNGEGIKPGEIEREKIKQAEDAGALAVIRL